MIKMSALKDSMVAYISWGFLWLVVLAVIVIGVIALAKYQEEKYRKEEAQELHTKITRAQHNATPREWVVRGEQDPASRKTIARSASIQSDCGLCFLTTKKTMAGSDFTLLWCPDIGIDWPMQIEVKFDTHDTSKTMVLNYGDTDWRYITGYSNDYWGFFINGLLTANIVAIEITPANDYVENFWVRFTLKGSNAAIGQLGK